MRECCARLRARFATKRIKTTATPALTEREKGCLLWLSRGLRIKAIADKLNISEARVNQIFKQAQLRLKAKTRRRKERQKLNTLEKKRVEALLVDLEYWQQRKLVLEYINYMREHLDALPAEDLSATNEWIN